jgi:hypothetical protein
MWSKFSETIIESNLCKSQRFGFDGKVIESNPVVKPLLFCLIGVILFSGVVFALAKEHQ